MSNASGSSDLPVPTPTDTEPITESPKDGDRAPEASVPSGHGGEILISLLNLHPFMGYFCWLADRQYGADSAAHVRVARLRKRTKRAACLYTLCVVLDVVLTAIVTVALVALAVTVAAKAVWPPPFWAG